MNRFTKTQVWSQVEEVLSKYKSVPKGLIHDLEELIKPKSNAHAQNTIEVDGETLYYCRYTNKYWPCDEMVYQNDEKRAKCQHKGYSKVGISLWSKARKEYQKLKDELTRRVRNKENDLDELITKIDELEKSKAWNDYNYLIQFASQEQLDKINQAIEA